MKTLALLLGLALAGCANAPVRCNCPAPQVIYKAAPAPKPSSIPLAPPPQAKKHWWKGWVVP